MPHWFFTACEWLAAAVHFLTGPSAFDIDAEEARVTIEEETQYWLQNGLG